MPQALNKPKKRKKYKPRALGKSAREVFELIKTHWPVTPSEVIRLKNYIGPRSSGHGRFLHNFKALQKAGLVELKKSGRVYIAWPKDIERLRNDELRNGLLGLKEAVVQVVDGRMKERPKARQ